MAERRMFAKSIVTSDAFLDMPMSSRCLYFTLGMLADDDGFVNNPKSIMRQVGATNDDMQVLLAKKFIIIFESGVIVIKHWRMNNYLRSDRYTETKYLEEKASIEIDKDGIYHKRYTNGIPKVDQVLTQDRIGEDSIGQDRKDFTFTYKERVRACEEVKNLDIQTKKALTRIAENENLTDKEFDILLKGLKNAIQLGCFTPADFSFLASRLEDNVAILREHIAKGERNARLIERVIKDYAPR